MVRKDPDHLGTVNLAVVVDVCELAQQLSNGLSRDQVFNLVKLLDRAEADFDFTDALREYFVREIQKAETMIAEKESADSVCYWYRTQLPNAITTSCGYRGWYSERTYHGDCPYCGKYAEIVGQGS